MFTIFLLVIVIFLVFAFIVFRQVRSAEERRLRLLAGFANRVEVTVEEIASRFARIATERCEGEVREYIGLIPNVEYVDSVPSSAPCPEGRQLGEMESRADDSGAEGGPTAEALEWSSQRRLSLVDRGGQLDLVYVRNPGSEPESSRHDPDEGAGDREPERSSSQQSARWAVERAEASIDLDEIVGQMIIPGIFDSVLIAGEGGEVLLQQGVPELKARRLDALLGRLEKPSTEENLPKMIHDEIERLREAIGAERSGSRAGPPAPSPGDATAVAEARIADIDYKIFLQPITIRPEVEAGRPATTPFRWVAVGLISSENLLSAGVTTSPVLLFILVSLFPLALISWPFLKITLTSRRQPFNRLDFASLILATLLALSFLALLLVDGLFLATVRSVIDRQLEDLATTTEDTFRFEILDAFHQMQVLDRNPRFNLLEDMSFLAGDDVKEPGAVADPPDEASERTGPPAAASPEELPEDEEDSSHLASQRGPTAPPGSAEAAASKTIIGQVSDYLKKEEEPLTYPYFDAVLWPDDQGDVTDAYLPLVEHAILPQSVRDRDYFLCARSWEDRVSLSYDAKKIEAWGRRNGVCVPRRSEGLSIDLCIQPILDRASGRPAVALSRSRGVDSANSSDRPVVALITRLPSLTNPALPPEFGLAIVEDSGQVLFHSDPRRAHTEDFANASDENRLLQSLLETRRRGALSTHYWGRRHRTYVKPIEGLPWSVVVFRSLEDVRLRNFELIYDFLNPFVLVLIVFIVAATLFKFLTPRRFRAYLWPTPAHLPAYRCIVFWTLSTLAVFIALFLLADPLWVFYASLLVVPSTVLFVVVFLPALHRERPSGRSWYERMLSSFEPIVAKVRNSRGWEGSTDAPSTTSESGGADGGEASWQARTSAPRKPSVRARRWRLAGSTGAVVIILATTCVAVWRDADILLTWLGCSFASLLVARWWFRDDLRNGEQRRKAYILTLGCLLLISFLPSIGFLRLASDRQLQYLVQDAQMALLTAIERRDDAIREIQGPLTGLYDSYRHELVHDRTAYLESVFDSRIDESRDDLRGLPLWPYGADPETGSFQRWMHQLFAGRPIPLNDLTPAPSGIDLSRFAMQSGSWRKMDVGDRAHRLHLMLDPSSGASAGTALSSVLPGSDVSIGLLVLVGMVLGLLVLLIAPFFFAWFIAEKLLLISLVYLGRRAQKDEVKKAVPMRARPQEAIVTVLAKARDSRSDSGVIKRLVVVAGQLDREAWSSLVTRLGEESDPPEFREVSFRDTWRRVATAADTSEEGGASGSDDSPAPQDRREAGVRDDSRRFAAALAREPKGRGDAKNPILLLVDFDPEMVDPEIASDQSHGIRELVEEWKRSVIILTDVLPVRPTADTMPPPAGGVLARHHWIHLLGSFPVRHARDVSDLVPFLVGVKNIKSWLDDLLEKSYRRDTQLHPRQVEHWRKIVGRIDRECQHTPTLRQIGRQLLRELVGWFSEVAHEVEAEEQRQPEGEARREVQGDSYLDLITEEHVIARIEAEARLHYRYLWNQCSTDEKLALYQLAKHGLVNPKYFFWVLDLVQRGLIIRQPDLRLMNDSFRNFVLYEVDRSQVLQWEEEMGTSAWGLLKWILPFPLLFLAGFLFITQRDAVSNAAGVLIALASLAPVVFNLYGKFQEVNLRRTESRASADES